MDGYFFIQEEGQVLSITAQIYFQSHFVKKCLHLLFLTNRAPLTYCPMFEFWIQLSCCLQPAWHQSASGFILCFQKDWTFLGSSTMFYRNQSLTSIQFQFKCSMSALGVQLSTKFLSLTACCIKMFIDYSFCLWLDKLYPNYSKTSTAVRKNLNFSFTELWQRRHLLACNGVRLWSHLLFCFSS